MLAPLGNRYTIASLRLNIEDAEAGRSWLLLPEGFRTVHAAKAYPLPTGVGQLQRLVNVPFDPGKTDSGVIYLGRAARRWQALRQRKISTVIDTDRSLHEVQVTHVELKNTIKDLTDEARAAVDQVKAEADKQIANLSDLFSLGRKGIEGQMRAHLDGETWKGEDISAKDFRECFRMVSQAVKGLGLPSEQRDKAREAVMEEAAAAAKSTFEALALAPGGKDPEVEH